jgi:pimeloyl-ACP methyl ester carboxylesterase
MGQFGYPAYGDMGTGKSSTFGTYNDKKKLHKKSEPSPLTQSCKNCLKQCCYVINGIVYSLIQLILLIVFVLGACYPVFLTVDTYRYRDTNDLYTVHVEGHKPLAMFLKCRGNGNETIIYENGLGGIGYMVWDFIPKMLEDRYLICFTDRRGYGWSETYEYDHFDLLTKPAYRQYSATNSEIFVKLIKEAGISTPFYYIGHSYGGHHLVQVALHHPEMVKGLVFLDSSQFSAAVDSLHDYLELIENFKGLAPLYIATALAPGALAEAFKDTVMTSEMTNDTRQKVAIFYIFYYQ